MDLVIKLTNTHMRLKLKSQFINYIIISSSSSAWYGTNNDINYINDANDSNDRDN